MNLEELSRRISNRIRDYQLNISTRGIFPPEAKDHVHYATVSYSCTEIVLRKLALVEEDTSIDVGCGMGRVVCLSGRRNVSKVVGKEYSTTLAALAEQNAKRLKGRRSRIIIDNQPSETYNYSDATALYFFNPFEASILDSVLDKIRADRAPRSIRLAFVMESEAQKAVFMSHTFIDAENHSVAFYRNYL